MRPSPRLPPPTPHPRPPNRPGPVGNRQVAKHGRRGIPRRHQPRTRSRRPTSPLAVPHHEPPPAPRPPPGPPRHRAPAPPAGPPAAPQRRPSAAPAPPEDRTPPPDAGRHDKRSGYLAAPILLHEVILRQRRSVAVRRHQRRSSRESDRSGAAGGHCRPRLDLGGRRRSPQAAPGLAGAALRWLRPHRHWAGEVALPGLLEAGRPTGRPAHNSRGPAIGHHQPSAGSAARTSGRERGRARHAERRVQCRASRRRTRPG